MHVSRVRCTLLQAATAVALAACGPRVVSRPMPDPAILTRAASAHEMLRRDSTALAIIDGVIVQPAAVFAIPSDEVVALEVVFAGHCREASGCRVLQVQRCGARGSGISRRGRVEFRSAPCPWPLPDSEQSRT